MSDFTKTASAKSKIQLSGSDLHTSEAFVAALTRGFDKVFKREFDVPMQGMQFFREEKIKRETATYQTYRGIGGTVGQNRDADDIPYVTRGDGFGFSVQTYTYRQGIGIEKTLSEVDDVGVTRGLQADLARNAKMTLEYAMADVFNRALGTAPFLCDDGMYLLDSDRPNADPAAANWSNLESSGQLTETLLFTAQYNARRMTGEDGLLSPTFVKKIVIRPAAEKDMWVLLNSDQKVGGALNDANWAKGTFSMKDVIVYDWMTTSNIIYMLDNPKSDANELMFFWRVRPEFETFKDGSNPDITRQRVRFAFGIGCGSPRKMWRGGTLS